MTHLNVDLHSMSRSFEDWKPNEPMSTVDMGNVGLDAFALLLEAATLTAEAAGRSYEADNRRSGIFN